MSSTNAANVGNDVESKLTSDVEKVRLDDRGVAVPPASKPQPAPISRTVRTPIVLERAVTGRVKWFDFQKGYGFITRDDGRDDVFVHASAIVRKINCGLVLIEGQKVEFDIIDGFKGREATTVSGPGGMRVGNVLQYMSQSQQQKQRGGNPNRIGGYNGGIRAPIQQRNGNQQRYSASGEGKQMHRGPFNARSRPSYDNNRNSTGNGHRFSNNTNGDAGSKDEKDTIEEVAEKREKGSNA